MMPPCTFSGGGAAAGALLEDDFKIGTTVLGTLSTFVRK